MTTIALVGAGPGLGIAVARRFGAAGHSIALVSRRQENVDRLAADLQAEGLTARGYAASVREPAALTAVLAAAAEDLGPVAMLHQVLAPDNVHVGQLIVPGAIEPGHRRSSPEALADLLWRIHTDKGEFRTFAEPMSA